MNSLAFQNILKYFQFTGSLMADYFINYIFSTPFNLFKNDPAVNGIGKQSDISSSLEFWKISTVYRRKNQYSF